MVRGVRIDAQPGRDLTATRSIYGWSTCRARRRSKAGACTSRSTSPRLAVDVGAHVGFWSYYLVLAFRNVHAFEPSEHRVALGEAEGRVELAVVCGNS